MRLDISCIYFQSRNIGFADVLDKISGTFITLKCLTRKNDLAIDRKVVSSKQRKIMF